MTEYNDEGVPICGNCEESAEDCECWQDETIEEIIAWQLANNTRESEFLQVKDDDTEVKDEDTEESGRK